MPAIASAGFVVGSPCAVTAQVAGIGSLAFSAMRILPMAASLVAMSQDQRDLVICRQRDSDRIVADHPLGAAGRGHQGPGVAHCDTDAIVRRRLLGISAGRAEMKAMPNRDEAR